MGLFSEARALDYKIVGLYFSGFLGIVASGFLIIFQFKPELIEKYDDIKTILFSAALTMPIATINIITVVLITPRPKEEEKEKDWRINSIGAAFF
jgi:hypothetical protein